MNVSVNVHQIRAARGLLGWSQKELARRSDVSDVSIINYENGKRTPHQNTIGKILRAFTFAGIEFTDDGGIRPRQSRVVSFEGREGFQCFFDDIYETAKTHEFPSICSTSQREDLYDYWLGDYEPVHNRRMSDLGIKVRTLIKEGDTYQSSTGYSEYRWMNKELFQDVSVYIYGDKMAFVNFTENDVIVTVVESSRVADSMRKMFNVVWELSSESP